jgi:4-carboxymuconolactone decarboxylase
MTGRFRPLDEGGLTPEQRRVFDAIRSGPRAGVPHIFHLLLESPDLAARVQALGAHCRYRTGLPAPLTELAILITARHWDAEYEWSIHESEARKAGLTDAVIAAVREGRRPDGTDADLALVHEFCTTFFGVTEIPDALFAAAEERFGRRGVVELSALIGYYSMLAMLIRIFRLPPEE